MMTSRTRTATCRCGQLRATVAGEPVRVSVCHCLNCKKRSGSAFAVQARWPSEQVVVEGCSKFFKQTSDSGNWATFHFCAECGSDVYYVNGGRSVHAEVAGFVAIPLGAFDDPFFAAPNFSVWEERKHSWVEISGEGVEHD
ncbi:GFA family protein [Sphingomonas sp. GCM10030256]|uniref:GFA family protein n=1 Tax=Sphingomonas sp. GCM10030256 TaxID=3273427 RepID=UPI00360744D3